MAFVGQMAGSLLITSAAALFVWYAGSAALPVAVPFILAWLVSPGIARWVSLSPADAGRLAISPPDGRALRLIRSGAYNELLQRWNLIGGGLSASSINAGSGSVTGS